jgi:parallel beta-helix repeat protein
MKPQFWITSGIILLVAAPAARAAEIVSNRAGGGPWSDPASWRGNKVPGPDDDVVIQKHDVMSFDRNDDGKITCRNLQIDPKGGLTFKKGAGKVVCCAAGEIENFGAIRLDAANSAGDFFELRLVADKADRRKLKVMKGGALLLYGRHKPRDGRPNVVLTSPKNEKQEYVVGAVEAVEGSALEVRDAQVNDMLLNATKIDNTGAKLNERLNFIDSRFIGQARIYLHTCDTPVIVRNTFDWPGAGQLPGPAVSVNASPLAEVKDNTIRGNFAQGITLYANSEVAVIGNTIEKCPIGIHSFYSLNSMIKSCTVRNCEVGVSFYSATGTVEDVVIEGAVTALSNFQSTVQAATVEVKDLAKKGQAILHEGGGMTLLNCNINPAQVKLIFPKPDPAAKPPPIPVTAFHYLIVGVKGAPAGTAVEVRTANPAIPADAPDPNVRSSPAPLTNDLTPLPRTLAPLIVKAWTIDLKGATLLAPEYAIKILGPAAKEGAPRALLKTQAFRSTEAMFRAQPNALSATLEMMLK